MTCRELTEFLDCYLDDELPADMKRQFESHLTICADCRAFLDAYAQTVQAARLAAGSAMETAVPESLILAILDSQNGRTEM